MFGLLRRAASVGLRTNARTGCPIVVSCRISSCPLFPVVPVISITDYLPVMSPRSMVVLSFHQTIRNQVLEDFCNQSMSCILRSFSRSFGTPHQFDSFFLSPPGHNAHDN